MPLQKKQIGGGLDLTKQNSDLIEWFSSTYENEAKKDEEAQRYCKVAIFKQTTANLSCWVVECWVGGTAGSPCTAEHRNLQPEMEETEILSSVR